MEETNIFISYAHKDDANFKIFKEGIESHSKSSKKLKWKILCDKEIPTGSLWHNVIQEEIKTCNAAILLVSANFLSSDYIENEEFLHFLERNEKEGFIFLPILLSDCDITQWENLSKRQFFNPQGQDYEIEKFKHKIVPYDYIEKQHLKNTYHRECVSAFEKVILSKQNTQQNLISKDNNSSLMSALSNKDILNALSLFQGQIKERELNEEELTKAVDFKNKLYNEIFGNFDNQLETTHKNKLASVIFDRIVLASEQIQKPDIDTIQTFRNNKVYEYRDRSLVVSGLTISLLNHFDSKKIHLLIDFLTDFEEEVWQKALVGLLFTLTRYNNRLSLFPEIGKRLNELKEITDIQKSICVIDRILRNGTFSSKELYKNNPNFFFSRLKMLFGNSIDFSRQDFIEIQDDLEKLSNATTIESKIMNSLFNKEIIDKFICALGEKESITMTVEELFKLIDFDTYIELNELNPFQVNLTDDFFKSSRNWFLPFKDDENIRNVLVNNFSVEDIDVLNFISMIQQSTIISDIDKHYILTHIKQFSDDFIHIIYTILLFDVFHSRNKSTLELIIVKTIRDLYRFSKLSVIALNNNVFDKKLSIYGQSLLEKIANNITEIKVNSQYMYDNDKYEESLKYLQNIPTNKYDFEILALFVNNYIELEQDEKAIPYLNELLALFENDKTTINSIEKAKWYQISNQLYIRLEEKEPDIYSNMRRSFLNKEISLKEKIFKELSEKKYDLFQSERSIGLADCYFDASVIFWNYDKNLIDCFSYKIKYLNVFFQIHNEDNTDNLLQEIKQRQKSITIVFQMIFENDEIEISQLLNAKCENIHKSLQRKVIELFQIFEKINDTEPFFEILKQNYSIQELETYLYNIMCPIAETEKEKSTLNDLIFRLLIRVDDLAQREEKIITRLSPYIKKELFTKYVEWFLDNLFFEDELPPLSKEIIENSIVKYFAGIHIHTKEYDVLSYEKKRRMKNKSE